MNWTEKLFLAVALLVGGGVLIVTLGALGVPIPYLNHDVKHSEAEGPLDGIPAPLAPPEEEPGLLAELGHPDAPAAGPESVPGIPGEEAVVAGGADEPGSGMPGTAPAGTVEEHEADGKPVRDPAIDKLKAAVDTKDVGEIMAFLIGTFTPHGTKLSEEDLDFLLAALNEHEDYGLRNLIFAHLERIGGSSVTEGVLAFLKDEKNPAAIQRALGTLRAQNDEAAVKGLVDYMAGARNHRLREAAFQNLLRTRNPAATDSLLTILDRSTDQRLKQYALAAVSQLGGEAGADAVLRYAASTDPYERSIGLKSLRDIRSPEAVPVLSDAVSRQADPYVRGQAIRALGRIRDPRAIEPVGAAALDDTNRAVRVEAIRTLASIGRAEAIPTLQYIAENDANRTLKRVATKAIQTIERAEARRAAKPRKKKR